MTATIFNIANYIENFIAKCIQSQIWQVWQAGWNGENFAKKKGKLSITRLNGSHIEMTCTAHHTLRFFNPPSSIEQKPVQRLVIASNGLGANYSFL